MPEVLKTVGRYEVLREVGRGGMARVYLARQSDLDRFVALKELDALRSADSSHALRFLRESRVAGSLSHPNIVTVHDYFEHGGTPYIAMEYIERGSLRPYVKGMPLPQVGGVLEGLLAGLGHAESYGIVHRDLKPGNVLVTVDGRVKIADFGLAKATMQMQDDTFLDATGTTVGTPAYMAPELAMAQDVGPWTDLYSVGCMAFELFTGNVPFHDSDAPMAILLRQVNELIPPVKSIVPEVDQRVSDWIDRLLIKEPRDRTQNAQDAWDDFEEILLLVLGPRWRREARLGERPRDFGDAKPLTPAPFGAPPAGDPESEEFKSFAWGAPNDADPPPPYEPPPASAAPAEAFDDLPDDTDFVTYGAPARDEDDAVFSAPAPPMPEEAVVAPAAGADLIPSALREEPPAASARRGLGFPGWGAFRAWRARARRGRPEAVERADAPICRTPHIDVAPTPRLTPGETFEAIVFADLERPRRGETAEPIVLVAPPDREEFELAVWLVATRHFRILDTPVKPLTLRRAEPRSSAARFRVMVQHAPPADEEPVISASFSYQGRPTGKVTLTLGQSPVPAPDAEGPVLVVDADAVQPDLALEIISVENDGRRFEVRVDTPLLALGEQTETWWLPAESPALVAQAMQRFFDEHAGRSARIASLLGAGMEFFDAAPELFKQTFWQLHDAGRPPRNLYVVSDERSIPWELMVPRRRTHAGVETLDPLGVQLAVGRWHRQTQVSPPQRMRLQTSYVVAPRYSGVRELVFSGVEADYVCEHFHGQRIDPVRFDHLEAVLAGGGADLLHFVCHGESDRGGVPVLLLEEPEILDAQQIRAMRGLAAAFGRHRPLVFLNACELGRPVRGLLGASGFARSFIELDASGVIGTLWSVDDRAAHDVAIQFYEQLREEPGVAFAEVLRRIRARAFAVAGDDSFAAYCFYGDPAAHVAA